MSLRSWLVVCTVSLRMPFCTILCLHVHEVSVPMPLKKVSSRGQGELCISSLQRLAYYGWICTIKREQLSTLLFFCTRSCFMKLLSFSYLAEQPVLIVKDPVHLPNHLPHHNASKIKTIIIRTQDPVLIRSEKEWKVWFPHLKYILIMNKWHIIFNLLLSVCSLTLAILIYFTWIQIVFTCIRHFILHVICLLAQRGFS